MDLVKIVKLFGICSLGIGFLGTVGCDFSDQYAKRSDSSFRFEEDLSWFEQEELEALESLNWRNYDELAEDLDLAFLLLSSRFAQTTGDFPVPEWKSTLDDYLSQLSESLEQKPHNQDPIPGAPWPRSFVAVSRNQEKAKRKQEGPYAIQMAYYDSMEECERETRKEALAEVAEQPLTYLSFWSTVIFVSAALDGCADFSKHTTASMALETFQSVKDKLEKGWFLVPSIDRPVTSYRALILARGLRLTVGGMPTEKVPAHGKLFSPFAFVRHDNQHADNIFESDMKSVPFPGYSDEELTFNGKNKVSFINNVKKRFEFAKSVAKHAEADGMLYRAIYYLHDNSYTMNSALRSAAGGEDVFKQDWHGSVRKAAIEQGLIKSP